MVFTRKSDAVSPMAVVSNLVAQNRAVTAGTVLRIHSASRTEAASRLGGGGERLKGLRDSDHAQAAR
jgi:hypothetical protein